MHSTGSGVTIHPVSDGSGCSQLLPNSSMSLVTVPSLVLKSSLLLSLQLPVCNNKMLISLQKVGT